MVSVASHRCVLPRDHGLRNPCACADIDLTATPAADASMLSDISITEISLDNTLLLDAVNKGKARFVSDCASYLQVCVCL